MQTQCPNCGGYKTSTTAIDYLDPVTKTKVYTYSGWMLFAKITAATWLMGSVAGLLTVIGYAIETGGTMDGDESPALTVTLILMSIPVWLALVAWAWRSEAKKPREKDALLAPTHGCEICGYVWGHRVTSDTPTVPANRTVICEAHQREEEENRDLLM